MSKDCDVFFDSYGCVITKNVGYQAPFPVVRLSSGAVAADTGAAVVQGVCFASSLLDRHAARGRLLSLNFSAPDACVSFLQLLDPSRRPVELDARTEFVRKVAVSGNLSAVVARDEHNGWGTAVYVQTDTHVSRVAFRRAAGAALSNTALWLLEAGKGESGASTASAAAAPPLLLHSRSVAAALGGEAATPHAVSAGLRRLLDVVALAAETAVVVGSGGVAVADRRAKAAQTAVVASVAVAAVAAEEKVVAFGEDAVLRVFDLRHTATPLLEATSSAHLCVRAKVGSRAALLVSGDSVGVLDVQTLTVTASLQHSGDAVLDAAVLPHDDGGGVRVCASTASGMVYDWIVAM